MATIANVGSRWDAGKLVFFSKVTGNTLLTLDPDTDSLTITGFGPAENQADSTANDTPGVVSDLNDLLDKLKAAGLMAADET